MTDTGTLVLAQAQTADDLEDAVTGTQPEAGPNDLGQMLAEEVQSDVGMEQDSSGMPQLAFEDYPPQLVWLAITFVALYLLMSRIALPRIATVIENRRDRIASDLDTAARLKQETDDVIAAYEAELADARSKAHTIASETRSKLNEEIAAERAKVEEDIAERTSKAEAAVTKAKTAALKDVDATAAETAGEIVTALIGAKPTAKELDEAVKTARGA